MTRPPGILAIATGLLLLSCSESKLYEQARQACNNGDFQTCEKKFHDYTIDYPRGSNAAEAHYRIGYINHVWKKNYYKALDSFDQVLKHFPDSQFTFDAGMGMAAIYSEKFGNYADAVEACERVVKVTYDEEKAARARYEAALLLVKLKQYPGAMAHLEKIAKGGAKSDVKTEAGFQAASVAYLEGRTKEASQMFEDFARKNPKHRLWAEARFNMAQCSEELEELDRAVAILEGIKDSYPNREALLLKIDKIEKRKMKRRR
jgi:TolA-binding protein